MNCIIAGNGSEIGRELGLRLMSDGWEIEGIPGRDFPKGSKPWDMLILCQGQLTPIGKFFDCDIGEWAGAILVNAIHPLGVLQILWPLRRPNAKVVFLGGPNMLKTSPTYTAYRAGKAVLESIVGTLECEYPDVGFRILHPGVVKTKIHDQTLKAGHKAANYERVMKIVNGGESTVSHDEVYQRLKAVL